LGKQLDVIGVVDLQFEVLGPSEWCTPDFLSLWKDADPDIPILKQAKAEYAKLQ